MDHRGVAGAHARLFLEAADHAAWPLCADAALVSGVRDLSHSRDVRCHTRRLSRAHLPEGPGPDRELGHARARSQILGLHHTCQPRLRPALAMELFYSAHARGIKSAVAVGPSRVKRRAYAKHLPSQPARLGSPPRSKK